MFALASTAALLRNIRLRQLVAKYMHLSWIAAAATALPAAWFSVIDGDGDYCANVNDPTNIMLVVVLVCTCLVNAVTYSCGILRAGTFAPHSVVAKFSRRTAFYLATFVICWLPFLVWQVRVINDTIIDHDSTIFSMAQVLEPTQGFLNALVYGWYGSELAKFVHCDCPRVIIDGSYRDRQRSGTDTPRGRRQRPASRRGSPTSVRFSQDVTAVLFDKDSDYSDEDSETSGGGDSGSSGVVVTMRVGVAALAAAAAVPWAARSQRCPRRAAHACPAFEAHGRGFGTPPCLARTVVPDACFFESTRRREQGTRWEGRPAQVLFGLRQHSRVCSSPEVQSASTPQCCRWLQC
jgi:hypothetical protein